MLLNFDEFEKIEEFRREFLDKSFEKIMDKYDDAFKELAK
jgi:hypothetical protein